MQFTVNPHGSLLALISDQHTPSSRLEGYSRTSMPTDFLELAGRFKG